MGVHVSRLEALTEQECIPVGCVPSAAVAVRWVGCLPGWVSAQGVSARGGVCLGGCLPRGVCLVCLGGGGVGLPSLSRGVSGRHPPGQNSWHTLVKTLPFRNATSFADGNNRKFITLLDIMAGSASWPVNGPVTLHSIHQNHSNLWDNRGHSLMITRQMPTKANDHFFCFSMFSSFCWWSSWSWRLVS